MKYFILTVDTEGDNLWTYKKGDAITTENTNFIPRFQSLCEKYEIPPVYLTNYEMALDKDFVKLAKSWHDSKLCEIGIHLHAWNNPPIVDLKARYLGQPYLIEYENQVMHNKFNVLFDLISSNFGVEPKSHRAGRWAMNDEYFKLLNEFNITADCSYTPFIDWSMHYGETRGGCDYSTVDIRPSMIQGVWEVPATVRKIRNAPIDLPRRIKSLISPRSCWLRPATQNISTMKRVIDIVEKENETNYLEFMIHSSELMPGCSPYFPDSESIEILYQKMTAIFEYAKTLGYKGCSLRDYTMTLADSHIDIKE